MLQFIQIVNSFKGKHSPNVRTNERSKTSTNANIHDSEALNRAKGQQQIHTTIQIFSSKVKALVYIKYLHDRITIT